MQMSSPSVTVLNVLLAFLSKKSVHIPVQLVVPSHTLQEIDSHIHIDSGVQISCIDWDFVKKHQLPYSCLDSLISM